MNVLETIEQSAHRQDVADAVETAVFDEQLDGSVVAHSLQIAERSQSFEPQYLLDEAAARRLQHMYVAKPSSNGGYPAVLSNWKGDATEGTLELLAIARGDDHPDADAVAAYQEEMRAKLPSQIPLVRGGGRNSKPLESWSASVSVARMYGDDTVIFTVVPPEYVFMCSLYGPLIGEQEFTPTAAGSPEQHSSTLKTHVELYQRMNRIL